MAGSLTVTKTQNEKTTGNTNECVFGSTNNCTKLQNVSIFDLIVLILSVSSIFIDLCTDLVLVIQYSRQGYITWALSTFMLIFFPSLVVQFFSLRWHIVDNTASVLHWVLHFCMLGIFHRYIQTIIAAFGAFKSKNSTDIKKLFFDQNDLCMLHLFESFLESAPQLVLQVYVIAMLKEWKFWTGLSALASLLSLAWALAAYTKAQRRARGNKNLTTWPGLLLQGIWRTGMLTSRISTLVLAAYCFGNYVFLMITIHWLAMTIWIIYQKTDFCETYWEEKIYNAVVGVIYCFCFFNLHEGQSRWRALIFYLVIVLQNLTCLTIFLMWFSEKTPRLAVSAFIAIIGGITFGSAGMLFYYRFFHPSGPIKFFFYPQSTRPSETSTFYSSNTLRSLKRIRCETQGDCHQRSASYYVSKLEPKNEKSFSDSIVIIEENLLEDSDDDIKILQKWINEPNDRGNVASSEVNKTEMNETEGYSHKRRAICSSSDLVKLMDSKTKSDGENLKLAADETNSEILSTRDYENLCAVNIARESWGLRSWRVYSDIETWIHDDSTVHDRRLDTLTSTTGSEFSEDVQKESERARQDDYIETIAEDLSQCDTETNSDYVSVRCPINSLPEVFSLGPLDPIFEEIEEPSVEDAESTHVKNSNGSASTLVATIEKIRMNTPVQNCYRMSDRISTLSGIKPKFLWHQKNVSSTPELLELPENKSKFPKAIKVNENAMSTTKLEITNRPLNNKENITLKRNLNMENQESSKIETYNKDNISAVACKINYWNKIINTQNKKNESAGQEVKSPGKDYSLRDVISTKKLPTSFYNSNFHKVDCK